MRCKIARGEEWGLIWQDIDPDVLPHTGGVDGGTGLYVYIAMSDVVWFPDTGVDIVGLGGDIHITIYAKDNASNYIPVSKSIVSCSAASSSPQIIRSVLGSSSSASSIPTSSSVALISPSSRTSLPLELKMVGQ